MINKKRMPLSGWNNYPSVVCDVVRPEKYAFLENIQETFIPRGLGKSYGDASLNSEGVVVFMERLHRFLSFDEKTGLLRCEGGTTLKEILDLTVPKGWFLPVVPGTEYVTVGGCIAADIHGKNHFTEGSFSFCVKEISLILADGSTHLCSPVQESELFWATVGGMGLTGIVGEALIQLAPIESGYLWIRQTPVKNLHDLFEQMENGPVEDKYRIAWIDTFKKGREMGYGIVAAGRYATAQETIPKFKEPLHVRAPQSFKIPLTPAWLTVPRLVMKMFNKLYFSTKSSATAPQLIDYHSFFFPLDRISNWNLFFGKKGFIQYQFVIPQKYARASIGMILEEVVNSSFGCSLAVLKRFGAEGKGLLSFPLEGYTLAMDFPFSESLLPFLDRLDTLIMRYEGRVYLAKDARLSAENFATMYPRLKQWKEIKTQVDPKGKIGSNLSRRLILPLG